MSTGPNESSHREHGTHRVVRSPESPMNALCDLVERIAPFDIPVLITGESGTGKELLARATHYRSGRAEKPFVVENCGALPDELLESELFGHKRGSFTGAYQDRIGLFQQADGGTIFLDEIGDTSPAFQVKLLRVVQEREIRPVGGTRTIPVDVRVVSATNRDLEHDVKTGRFRQDLYYRLSMMTLRVPALRERPMDIPVIGQNVLERAGTSLGRRAKGFTREAVDRLVAYSWPGNVRELQNEIYRMLALSDGDWLGVEFLSHRVLEGATGTEDGTSAVLVQGNGSLRQRLEQLEARVLRDAMIRHRGNKTRAAEELGLSRVGLRAKLTRHGLDKPQAAHPAAGACTSSQPCEACGRSPEECWEGRTLEPLHPDL